MKNFSVLMAAITMFALGCGGKKNGGAASSDKTQGGWTVLKDGRAVQWVDDKSGPIISRGAPPPIPAALPTHPFLTTSSLDIASEGTLYALVMKSKDFPDYLRLLKEAGYDVKPAERVGWDVYKNGERVEWIDDKPGQLISRGAPPPSPSKPVMHPFISASSYDITTEGELYKLLKKATSFQDYVRLLKEAGYEVKPAERRP